jgi:NAD(P)-dependent dehydrogenase (short-subunit alcohol dehydrogenase family)
MEKWDKADIPSQTGKLAVVTGTGGLGYETALALAAAGAEVILAGRNSSKGKAALQSIHQQLPKAMVDFAELDLACLSSIERFANLMLKRARTIDVLINNAGIMTPPTRRETADGFELQFGTNYLGHFALTGRLFTLLKGHHARIVTVSSLTHRLGGGIHFHDLQWRRKYKAAAAYSQSKLANLIFALELQRRSDANGWALMSNAAHPGASTTDLIKNGIGSDTVVKRLNARFVELIGHSPAEGALPILFAATSRDAAPMGYYGPSGVFELKGRVGLSVISSKAKDSALAQKLWNVSEHLTRVQWPR